MYNVEIIGIKFSKINTYGDFNWMCKQEQYTGSLFIFNDNEECRQNCKRGAGNAIMRQYNKHSNLLIPRSAGIPTGTLRAGGYSELTEHAKKQIDDSILEIRELIEKHEYSKIYYSSEINGKLGTGIFTVDDKVLNYITLQIFSLSNKQIKIEYFLPNDAFDNYDILPSDDDDDEFNEEI